LQEFTRATEVFPIVFLLNTQKGEFRPVILLSLKPGVDAFVDGETGPQAAGGWRFQNAGSRNGAG